MATFKIHEDIENMPRHKNPEQTRIGVNRKRQNETRIALQQVDSNVQHEVKRQRFSLVNEISPIPIKVSEENCGIAEQKQKLHEEKLTLNCLTFNENRCRNKQEEPCLSFSQGFLHCAQYKQDIWKYLLNMESSKQWPKPNYMKKQMHLNAGMRCVLVDWLVAVAEEYKMNEQTLHLSIHYIDQFLSHMSVVREKFQLLGSAAMMVAGKLEEIYPPDPKEWAYLTGNTYTIQQVLRMEQLLLGVLRFELQPPTIFTFLQHLCVEHELDKKTMYLAMYFSELVLLEGDDYLNYLPSQLAASAIALARLTLSKRDVWPKKLRVSSGYTLKQLSPVVKRQNKSFRDSPTKTQQAIQHKYQTDRYHKVALLKAKSLDLEELEE